MARSKQSGADGKPFQLALFQDEPAETAPVEEQQQAAIPQKRVRTKKSAKLPTPSADTVPPEESKEPPVPVAASIPEESPVTQEPAATRLVEEREAALKAKFKKDQEARLEALKRARGKK